MAFNTIIQWCDSTVNPISGCPGCELLPPARVIRCIDQALRAAGVPKQQAVSRKLYGKLISDAYHRIPRTSPHHQNQVTTTNIWHLRKQFVKAIRERHGKAVAKAAEGAIEREVTCYAGKLTCNRGFSLLAAHHGGERNPHPGYAPTFEEMTRFEGRVWETAGMGDLRGTKRPDKAWLDGLPRLVFVSDMGDAFSRKSDFAFLKREVIEPIRSEEGRRHIWLWLTKRPLPMAEFSREIGGFPGNVCAMTTVTGPDTLHRVAQLKKVQAAVRGLSLEPLWQRIPPSRLKLEGIDWVICGGESGKAEWARPFPLEWAEELRDHCAAHGVAFFLKQLGRNPTDDGAPIRLDNGHGGKWGEWPQDLRVRQLPDCFRHYTPAARTPAR